MRKKSSNKALKSLFIMCFFLISASFLAPDVLDIWASTQKNDFRRELARDWSESIGDLSRKMQIDEIKEFSERIIDGSSSGEMLEPLAKPVLTIRQKTLPKKEEVPKEKEVDVTKAEVKSLPSSDEESIFTPLSLSLIHI